MCELQRFQLERDKAILLVIDVQERLVVTMDPAAYARMRGNLEILVQGMAQLGVPVIATEQYPRGLGVTVPELQVACGDGAIEKVSFGCCGEPGFLEHLKATGKTQVIVTGMEAHICVYQTVLGLLDAGFHVHLVNDGVISRHAPDQQVSVDNAARAGAVVTTTEIVLFQLLQASTAPEFKQISALIKNKG